MNERAEPILAELSRLRLGIVLLVAIAAGFVAWLAFRDDRDEKSSQGRGASAASVRDVQAMRDSVGHPVYWAGERRNQAYELTHTTSGNIFIRYLPSKADVGSPRPDYLTVGTYPFKRAYQTLEQLSKQEDAVSRTLPRGGIVVARQPRSLNAYLAYPGEDLQIEAYDKHPGRALLLASLGRIRPVP